MDAKGFNFSPEEWEYLYRGRTKPKGNKAKLPAAVELGARGGKKGGPARARSLTKEQRVAIARRGAAARWGQHGGKS